MDEVTCDVVVGLDLSRRGLSDLTPWLSPGENEEPPLGQLETLDASRNALKALAGMEHLPRLRVLNLYFNRVEELAELLRLRAAASTLRVLDLRLNPVTRLEGYRRCGFGVGRAPWCAPLVATGFLCFSHVPRAAAGMYDWLGTLLSPTLFPTPFFFPPLLSGL